MFKNAPNTYCVFSKISKLMKVPWILDELIKYFLRFLNITAQEELTYYVGIR